MRTETERKKKMTKMTIDTQNYVDTAESVIKKLSQKKDKKGKSVPMVTTSKIRNLLAMIADIYNEVMSGENQKLSEEICAKIEYLRVRFIYEAGREDKVKDLVREAEILDNLKGIGNSKENFILFNRYMEALVAFHRFYGGKDN
jgi:CRISPR-associated protein Csm2